MGSQELDDHLTIGVVVGRSRGIPGTVHIGKHRRLNQQVAVKKYNLDVVVKTQDFCDCAEFVGKEVMRMKQFRHENILPCLSAFVSGPNICIVTPYLSLGSVRNVLDAQWREGLPEPVCAQVLRDVLSALSYLHSNRVVHRSIRCSHILLDRQSAKLSGLGYACSLYDPPAQGLQDRYDYPLRVAATNLNWMSPEMLQQNLLGYNEKSDLYSLGVAACEMANGLVPFSEMSGTMMFLEKLRGASPKLLDRSTFEEGDESALTAVSNQESGADKPEKPPPASSFESKLPGDSGVGVSVGSSSNFLPQKPMSACTLEDLQKKASIYARRGFGDAFHDFVESCSFLDADQRPSAREFLASHPFFKRFRRTSNTVCFRTSLQKASSNEAGQTEPTLSEEMDRMTVFEDVPNTSWEF